MIGPMDILKCSGHGNALRWSGRLPEHSKSGKADFRLPPFVSLWGGGIGWMWRPGCGVCFCESVDGAY